MKALLDLQISRELAGNQGLSEPDYDVLTSLSDAPERQIRLSEMADRMLWSKSRLSHHVTRMQQRGLVSRKECDSDGRGAFIVLTDEGMATLEAAAPGHVAAVRAHFIDLLTEEQIRVLGDVTETVLEHLRAQDQGRPAGAGSSPRPGCAAGSS
ncbi:MarR family transcriptional regulator [Dactylosporangium vinaceum]|uniref:MarR family winged helix-turn-helix transcriptional regulator n=1 Tax=Dactylosporangium vinaceum TaxID=53362 RepID=A0ABV5LYR3_9ACTN|nr:MarR family transcriptional regulator [Dactylosporangium vinaceum]UAB95267.1 MarR family transcriptional regulator [Dactylosporangium vinaceum]